MFLASISMGCSLIVITEAASLAIRDIFKYMLRSSKVPDNASGISKTECFDVSAASFPLRRESIFVIGTGG
jgi:hypothetical protein